jgi:hypothetical protein
MQKVAGHQLGQFLALRLQGPLASLELGGKLKPRLLDHARRLFPGLLNRSRLLLQQSATEFFLLAINFGPGVPKRLLISGSAFGRPGEARLGRLPRTFGCCMPLFQNTAERLEENLLQVKMQQ